MVAIIVALIRFISTPIVTNPAGFHYILNPGESVKTFSQDLANQHLIDHPYIFKFMLRLSGQSRKLKAGEYHFPQGTSLLAMVNKMIEGRGIIYRTFTIVPGWSFHQLRMALEEDSQLKHTINSMNDMEVMQRINGINSQPEGMFFPDTYYFLEGSLDIALLKHAYQILQEKLNKAWEAHSDNLPFKDSYQALIAASLIEKESYLNEERPKIAGVLVNRLRKDMLLQFDPTVIYGMGLSYHGSIHRTDLRENTPYNTYVHKGLPPTPIAMPSMASIIAVMHPEQHDYLYFVARGDGSHQFSATLTEHNKAVTEEGKMSKPFFNMKLVIHYLGITPATPKEARF